MKPSNRSDSPLLWVSLRVYRLLLRIYPDSFRRSYQNRLEQAFLDLCRDAVRAGGKAFCRFWMAMLQDIGRSAFSQHRFGGRMRRKIALIGCILAILVGYLTHAQAQFTVSAAATDPVPGWSRVEFPDEDGAVWVSPTPSLTSDDIQGAQPQTGVDGKTVIAIQFTDEGSEKMRELSAAQMNRPIAIMLDGELISAPVVRTTISSRAELSGPNGLTEEDIQRILSSMDQ